MRKWRVKRICLHNWGANHGEQTCPKHAESTINSCPSVLQSDWSSQFTVCWRFLLFSIENFQSPSSAHPIVFTWDIIDGGAEVFGVQISSTCLLLSLSLFSVTLDFRLPCALAFACTFRSRFTVTFAWVLSFPFLHPSCPCRICLFPFPGDGIVLHRTFIVCVSGWRRPEDASAPQRILNRHA